MDHLLLQGEGPWNTPKLGIECERDIVKREGQTGAWLQNRLDPDHLVLEATESALIKGTDLATKNLSATASLGVGLALDDFGTGYSSLSYLQSLPVTGLKIDRSFVSQLAPGSRSAIIVEGLLEIARKLGIHVVAEGIETEDQASQLQGFGCSIGQGFLFSKAVPRDQAAAMLLHSAQRPASTELPSIELPSIESPMSAQAKRTKSLSAA